MKKEAFIENLIPVSEVAKMLSLHELTVRQYVYNNGFPFKPVRVGGALLFWRPDVQEYKDKRADNADK
jgi:excisionase family DNA binding protein